MAEQLLSSYLRLLPTVRPEMAVAWPLSFIDVDAPAATVFGLAQDQASVTTGWQFDYLPAGGTDGEVRAMFTGLLRWKSDIDGGPALVLENSNYVTMLLAEMEINGLPKLPSWWPKCRFLLYDQLDWTKVRAAITSLVQNLSTVVRQQLEIEQSALVGATDDQVARWFLGELRSGQLVEFALPIISGDALGGGEGTAGGRRRARVRAKENLDDQFFLNLCFYAYAFSQLAMLDDSAVPDAGLRASLLSHGVPVVASGLVRKVSTSPAAGDFSTVQSAVQAATPGDVILIADAGPYRAARVIDIEKPLTILGGVAGDALATPTPALSVVRGNRPPDGQRATATWATEAHGVFRVRNVSGGMVAVSNLRIENGADRQGGGIFVDDVHRVWIHNCVFTGNVAYAGGWLFEGFGGAVCTRHAGILIDGCFFAGNEANGRGGAVGVFGYGWPVVQNCRFEGNRAERLLILNPVTSRPFFSRPDGGALGLQMATPNAEDRFARIAAVASDFEGLDQIAAARLSFAMVNDGRLTDSDQDLLTKLYSGQIDEFWDADKLAASHGSYVLIRNNRFFGNIAGDDGGAIYATGLVFGRCEGNDITGNAAGNNGGGIRISTACDFTVEGGQIISNQSNRRMVGYLCENNRKEGVWRYKWITYAGGGVAARTSNLRLVNVNLSNNLAHRYAGGGVFFTSTDDGALPIPVPGMGTDWNLIRERLVRDPATGRRLESFAAFTLDVQGCVITGNGCGWSAGNTPRPGPENTGGQCSSPPTDTADHDVIHAKGGGIYALRYAEDSVSYPPIKIRIGAGTSLSGNTAAFSPTATELFVADSTQPALNNPVVDTGGLSRDAAGVLTSSFEYGAAS